MTADFHGEQPPGDGFIHAMDELGVRVARDFPRRPGDDYGPTGEVSLG